MIYANRDIIIVNRRLDMETRRDAYWPVQISGVTVYSTRSLSGKNNYGADLDTFMIRIPIDAAVEDGRQYVPENAYRNASDQEAAGLWTIMNNDMVIICSSPFEDVNESVFGQIHVWEEEVSAISHFHGLTPQPIRIVEYADNTQRGSDAVRHWRIGGA